MNERKTSKVTFEARVRRLLEKHGLFVQRNAASKFPDFVVLLPVEQTRALGMLKSFHVSSSKVFLVECKFHHYGLSEMERRKMIQLGEQYFASPVLATHDRSQKYREGKPRRTVFYMIESIDPKHPDAEMILWASV